MPFLNWRYWAKRRKLLSRLPVYDMGFEYG